MKTRKKSHSFYIVVSNPQGLLWEWHLQLPSLQKLPALFLGIVFITLFLFLFQGLFGNLDETETPEMAPGRDFTNNDSFPKKTKKLVFQLRNMQKKIDKAKELQHKIQSLSEREAFYHSGLPLLQKNTLLFSSPGTNDAGNSETGGGPDEAPKKHPLFWHQRRALRLSRAALADTEGFVTSYDFWIRHWPHLWPLRRKRQYITSGYGYRKNPSRPLGPMQFHKGVDLRGATGTPVQATADGIVHIARSKSYGYGKRVRIVHDTGFETLYGHLNHIHVSENQRVRAGQLIGLVGSTGNSTGPHLHYEVRLKGHAQNPMKFLDR